MKTTCEPSFPLLDLPHCVILRICSFLGRIPLFTPAPSSSSSPSSSTTTATTNPLPYDLLPLAATCHTCRSLARSTVHTLTFDAYSSWRSVASWLRFASLTLKHVRITPVDVQLQWMHQRLSDTLPPAVVLTSLQFHPFALRELDLSGLHMPHEHDAMLLAPLLQRVRTSLRTLILLDAHSAFRHVVAAVVQAKLHALTHFTFLSLRAKCKEEVTYILASFHPGKLTHLHLHVSEAVVTNDNETDQLQSHSNQLLCDAFPKHLCNAVTSFTFESEFETPQLVPVRVVRALPALRSLTLKNLLLDTDLDTHSGMLLSPSLETLQLDGCLVMHDEEMMLHEKSDSFLQVIQSCSTVLSSLWLPARYFSAQELQHIIEFIHMPKLTSLALTIPQCALHLLPRLFKRLATTLTSVRLSVLADDGAVTALPTSLNAYVYDALSCATSLSCLHFMGVYLDKELISDVLRAVGKRLQVLFYEVDPNDIPHKQLNDTVHVLKVAASCNHNVKFFCVEHEAPTELEYGWDDAKLIRQCVRDVVENSAFLNATNLNSLLSVWIAHKEEDKDRESDRDRERDRDRDVHERTANSTSTSTQIQGSSS